MNLDRFTIRPSNEERDRTHYIVHDYETGEEFDALSRETAERWIAERLNIEVQRKGAA
jgi:hypothetical protein